MTSSEYVQQHKQRLEWMPWLYFSLKERHHVWATPWQNAVQEQLRRLETVIIEEGCFVAESAHIFAEPGRSVTISTGASVGAEAFIHGPVVLGKGVGINPRVVLDGGSAGVIIGDYTRIATGCCLYAFDHGMDPGRLIREQPVQSQGIRIGKDVWIGANVCVRDGVVIGDHAVIGMGSVVTRDIPDWGIAVGNPAQVVADRRDKSCGTPSPEGIQLF